MNWFIMAYYKEEINEKLNLEDHMKGKLKKMVNGHETNIEYFGEEYTKTSKEWSNIDRKIDRKNDTYDEVIKNSKGEITHDCHEPLHEHTGHGSNKSK